MAAKKNKTSLLLLAVVATENSIRAVTPGGSLPKTRIRGDRNRLDIDDTALVSLAVIMPPDQTLYLARRMNLNPDSLLFEEIP
jgi:hypothetical protein